MIAINTIIVIIIASCVFAIYIITDEMREK
ncbi:hypothetical protein H3019_gp03 [Bacillus phage Karezi]|uniref:Uncharacterized protein n=1 Tax=Bacillus phage Karezi TaxID=2591398 RepID=A0A514AAR0_9CAUD|nr:hypothetical protein H3019_gp03 [Bacillus phage Karezi]QDH50356.1 hypothetical protein KAREZI_3 [Bacillus phage Karezi]